MEQDRELTQAVREVVIGIEQYRLRAAREAFGMGATEMIALSHLFVRGTCSPSGLAARLQITSPSVTELVDRLQRAGLVERSPHPHDRRRVVLALTPQAHDDVGRLFGHVGDAVTRSAAALTAEERGAVLGFLQETAGRLATLRPVVD